MRAEPGEPDFDAWYRDEWPRLVATFSMASGDRELGHEVAAEALARALERWQRVGRMSSPGGWTYRVGLNLLRRHHRRLALEKRALRRAQAGQPEAVAPAVSAELWATVRALPPRERTMVALRYGADLTEVDIAQLMDVAPGTVSATLNHARTRLRSALSDPIDEVHDGRA